MTDFGSFKWLSGDVNYTDCGGKWVRKVAPKRYHVIDLVNWIDAVGEREAADVGARYNVDLSEVDLNLIDPASALQSCGWFLAADGTIENSHDGDTVCDADHAELCIVEACHGYGNKAPLSDESGNNYLRMMRAARKVSRDLDDPSAYEDAMERPVNQIMTSARDYMTGDLFGRKSESDSESV